MARYLWTQKEDIGPAARIGHSITTRRVLGPFLFGGDDKLAGPNRSFLNDTWEWNGEYWTQIADIGPGPRRDHALCFDTVRNVALLFGGASGGGSLGDTWSWNGQDWTQLEDSGPSARAGHVMVFDSTRGRGVLFGGESATGLLNDTWEWDGDAWTQQEDTGPSPRKFHAMGFDLVRYSVVLFGGDPGNGNALGDTWSWDGSTWTQISNFGASPSMCAAMVSTDAQIAMFGGLNSINTAPPPTIFHESWVFDGKRWTHRQDIEPGPRWAHAMAFDTDRRNIVLFGGLPIFDAQGDAGLAGKLLGDTWEHAETDVAPTVVGPVVTALTLSPSSVMPRGSVTANVSLAAAAPPGTKVLLIITLDGSQGQVLIAPPIPIAIGATSGSRTFTAPQITGQITIQADAGSGGASAVLTMLTP
jgi:hypothetical protein